MSTPNPRRAGPNPRLSGQNPHWSGLAAVVPEWPVDSRVQAFVTGRAGGTSTGGWGLDGERPGGLNLGVSCGDDPDAVAANRARLAETLPSSPVWLRQVHGAEVHVAGPSDVVGSSAAAATTKDDEAQRAKTPAPPVADAAVTACPGVVLTVLTADCLPVFFADRQGRAVGVAHAGWRGLSGGVLENTGHALRALLPAGARLQAWLGPAIGPGAFEVGRDVVDAFCDVDPGSFDAFLPGEREGKWYADLYRLARRRLAGIGIDEVGGGGFCTFTDRTRFWSYRRQSQSGRMASLIWLAPSAD